MDFDSHSLGIFAAVMTAGSFSGAARELGISQPTVSQQIARLETELDGKLFQRVGREVFPTPLAEELRQFALQLLEQASAFRDGLRQSRSLPRGLVRYAMPESCQWTPHYREIMAQIPRLPGIQFEIRIQPSDRTVGELLRGELDFGFVVGERLAPELRFETFSQEAYAAVARDPAQLECLQDPSALGSARLITFPGWEAFFETWARSRGWSSRALSRLPGPTVGIGSLAGAIHALQEGAGVAVVPVHCVQDELARGRLRKLSEKPGASQPVHLARRIGEKMPRRVEFVLDRLRGAKKRAG
jgi:DNA-binding transcriptional LysR family regulator